MGGFYSDKGLEYLNNLAAGKAQYVFELDTDGNPIYPAIVLSHRNGDKVGVINNVQGLRQIFDLQETFEISFDVIKHCDGKECEVWDDIQDFMVVYIPMYKLWFEIYVTLRESDGLVKSVSGVHLPDAELSQIMLYNMEINSEEDLEAHESPLTGEYIKTTLYNPTNPSVSLLHRLLADKAPHYSIYRVDERLQGLWDEFDFNGVSISEAFDEIAERFNCIFIYGERGDSDSPSRTISVYDMLDYCPSCGKRGDYANGMCTECGNTEGLIPGYGTDTTIFISNENLANEVVSSNDVDNMKNCFRLEGGDDLMTATIVACNPAGSQYIWYFDDKTRNMMSPELQIKLIEYDTLLNYYTQEHETVISEAQVNKYNNLVAKYRTMNEDIKYLPDADSETPQSEIIGYTDLVETSYNIYDFATYLKTTMMPRRSSDETSAYKQIGYIDVNEMSPLGVSNASSVSVSTASLAVKNYVKVFVDTSRYEISILNGSITNEGNDRVWSGTVELTSYSDENDTAKLGISVILSDSIEATTKQKIDKLLAEADVNKGFGVVNIMSLDCTSPNSDPSPFELELRKHSLDNLNMFYSCAQDALNILIEQGVGDDSTSPVYESMYLPLLTKINMLESEAALRESEYKLVYNSVDDGIFGECVYKTIVSEISKINSALDMEKFLGEDLWLEYISYRRESDFQNSNFISDGLTNEELFEKAELFYRRAEKELVKSATLQHTITSTLKNLMVIPEFAPLLSYFKLGNWLRIKIDEKIYKLRLASYTLDYDNLDNLEVTFTDVHDQSSLVSTVRRTFAQSRARTSSYTVPTFTSNATDPLYYSSTGILVRTWDDEKGQFVSAQLRVLSKGIYYTDNTWRTVQNVRATIAQAYSQLEDLITHSGGLFMTQEVQPDESIIYYLHNQPQLEDSDIVWKMTANAMAVSSDGGQTWNAGITVDGDVIARIINAMGLNADWINAGTLRVVAEDQTVVFEADMDNKSVVINGDSVYINGTQFSQGTTVTDAINVPTTIAQQARTIANNAIHTITHYYGTSSSPTQVPTTWSTTVPQGGDGVFIWQYTVTQTANGSTQTDPVCLSMRGIQGAQGEQGLPGNSNYIHIKYSSVANPTQTEQMSEIPSEYIGICIDSNPTDPNTPSSYTWSKFQGEDGDQGIPGTNGVDGRTTYVHFAYASSADGAVGFSTSPYNGATHIGVLTDFVQNDSQTYSDYTWSLMKGSDGKGVSTTVVDYAASTSGTNAPSSGWSSTIPSVPQGSFLWTRTTITYTDNNTSVSYAIAHSGIDGRDGTDGDDGRDGTDGRGISSTATTYASSSDGINHPTSGWQSAIPTVAGGNFLWTKTTYTFTDSTTQDVYSSAKQGTIGESVSNITNYYVATSQSSGVTTQNPSDGTWTTAIQTITSAKPYLWNYEVISGSNGTTLSTTSPVIIGHFGTDGSNGLDGTSIQGITEYYAKSTSNSSSPADSAYSTSVPTLDSTNKYLWNYEKVTYKKPDGSTSTDETLRRIIGVYGDTGAAGYNTATIYLYQRATSAPSKPSSTLTYTFSTKALSGTLGNWSTTIPSGNTPIYVTAATALSNTSTDTIASSDWSSPVVLAQNGATGPQGGTGNPGINTATIYLYQRAGSTPNKPSASLTYTFSTKTLSGTPGNNWQTTIPTGAYPIYITFATAASTTDTDTIETSEWATPTILAQNGLTVDFSQGKMLYTDPSFKSGVNSISVYNNSSNGNVTHARNAKSSDNPMSDATHELVITNKGAASPGIGGFHWAHSSRANAIFVYRIIAKIPVGRSIAWATNGVGNNKKEEWLTNQAGTGTFTEYIFRLTCGSSGTFGTTGFFYLDGNAGSTSSPVTWYVAYATCFDMTNGSDVQAAKTTADAAKEEIDNLEIGGRNLFICFDALPSADRKINTNSGYTYDPTTGTYVITQTAEGSGFIQIYTENGVSEPLQVAGKEVTLSVQSINTSRAAADPKVYLYCIKSGGGTFSAFVDKSTLSRTVTIPADIVKVGYIIRLDQNCAGSAGETATFVGIKLEKGNRATDWTPAPEDFEVAIEVAEETATEALNKHGFCSCTTAAGTAAKTASLTGFQLKTGSTVHVTFTNANTVANPTLNINSTGAKAIKWNNAAVAASPSPWAAGECVAFVYDGTNWVISGQSNISADNIVAGSIAADRIKANVISAVNGGTGSINADKMQTNVITAVNAGVGTINAEKIAVEVGGRNLIRRTDYSIYGSGSYTNGSQATFASDRITVPYGKEVYQNSYASNKLTTVIPSGTTITCSVYVYSQTITDGSHRLYVAILRSNDTVLWRNIKDITSGFSGKLTWQYTLTEDAYGFVLDFDTRNSTSGQMVLGRVKAELGNKASDWTPAPEDVNAAVDNAAKTATSYITNISGGGITVTGNSASSQIQIASTVKVIKDSTHFAEMTSSQYKIHAGNATYPAALFGAETSYLGGDGTNKYFVKIAKETTAFSDQTITNGGTLTLYSTGGVAKVGLIASGTGTQYFNNSLGEKIVRIGANKSGIGTLELWNGAEGNSKKAMELTTLTLTNSYETLVNDEPTLVFYDAGESASERMSWYSKKRAFIRDIDGNGYVHEGYVVHGETAAHGITVDYLNSGRINFYVDTTSIGYATITSSDERMKTDIEPIEERYKRAAGSVELKNFRFDFNDPTRAGANLLKRFGAIAQDVIKALDDEGINYEDNELVETLEDDNGEYYTINYVPFLIARLAADEDRINELTTRLEALERR